MIMSEPSSVSRQLKTIAILGRSCGPRTIAPRTSVNAALASGLAGARTGVVSIGWFASVVSLEISAAGLAVALAFGRAVEAVAVAVAGFGDLAASAPRTPN